MPDEPREQESTGFCTETGDGAGTDSASSAAMTLENIIDMTGELEHLNELVMIHLGKSGWFTGQQSYFAIVTPVLDSLEIVIRHQYRPGMSRNEIKLIIQDWIDKEIAGLR